MSVPLMDRHRVLELGVFELYDLIASFWPWTPRPLTKVRMGGEGVKLDFENFHHFILENGLKYHV